MADQKRSSKMSSDFLAARKTLLLDALADFEPDVFFVELYPFGRKAFEFELAPVLGAIRDGRLPPCRVACGVRDILVEKRDQAAYEARVQTYRDKRKSEEEAARLAATIQPAANANEHGTGYAADILSADDPQQNTSFAETRAYEWLTAYAAEYGFILRYPQDRQAATGIVFEPWHWR